jgi:dipeptidase E
VPAQILAIGGGGFSDAERLTPLDRYLIDITGKSRPRACFLGTASGDAERYAAKFYRAYAGVAQPSDLVLFGAPDRDAVARLADQDMIFVGGGNTANMLAVWRLHGVDEVLRQAWQAGIVLAGISAGAICWFEACLTDSFGPQLEPLNDGLALLPGSACPHLSADVLRRSRYAQTMADGRLPGGYGIEDGAALHFVGTELKTVVSEVSDRSAFHFALRHGTVHEELLETVLLPGSE